MLWYCKIRYGSMPSSSYCTKPNVFISLARLKKSSASSVFFFLSPVHPKHLSIQPLHLVLIIFSARSSTRIGNGPGINLVLSMTYVSYLFTLFVKYFCFLFLLVLKKLYISLYVVRNTGVYV